MKMLTRLLKDDAGFIVSSELILLATIVVIGLITGLATVRDQVVTELGDVADAISEIDQSYSYSGVTSHSASTAGTAFNDEFDFCELEALGADQQNAAGTQCIVVGVPGLPEA